MTATGTASGAARASAASRSPSSTPAKPNSLAAALAILQQHLPRIVKGTEGQAGPRRYKYADLSAISAELLPVLGALGLSFTTVPTLRDMGGELKFILHCKLRHAPSGESDEGFYPLGTGNPQQLGSAISYARRYALNAMTGLAPDDGSDDDAHVAEQAARAQRNAPPEVREDGSATEAEQMRMNRGHEPGTERASGTAPDDPWYDQPPGNVQPEELPESSLPSQRQDIYIAMGKRDIMTPDARREAIERLTGRQIEAAKQMSFNEAAMVLAAVKAWDGRTESLLSPLAAERSKADA